METQAFATSMVNIEHDWVIKSHLDQNENERLDWKAMYPADFGFQALIIFRPNSFGNVQRNNSLVSPIRTEPVYDPAVTSVSKKAFTEPKTSDDKSKYDYRSSKRSTRPMHSNVQQPFTIDVLESGSNSTDTSRLTLTDNEKHIKPAEIVDDLSHNTKENFQCNLLKREGKSKFIGKTLWLKYLQMQSTSRLIQNVREKSFTEKSMKYWRLQNRV